MKNFTNLLNRLCVDKRKTRETVRTRRGVSGIETSPLGILRYATILLTLLVLSIGQMWGQAVSYSCGFENGTDSWSKNSMETLASETTEVRTGSKSLKCSCSNANGYARKSVSYKKGYYIHLILWAKSSANTSATTKMNGTQGGTTDITTSGWTRMTQSYNYTSSTGNKNTDVLPKMGSGNFFIDDVIVYYSSSSTTDITKPSSATSASATTSSISWTCGSDAGTSVQATLIFHRTGGSVGGNDLTLNDQGIYSLTATEGPKVVGNWTLLSASVAANATSYSGTFTAGDEYAIVHRDLAYNYSTPTYVTVAAASDAYDIHIGKNNDNYTDESLTNTSGSTWSKNITLDAGSYYEFKVKKTPSAGDAAWYGNNGRIFATITSWDFSTDYGNCKLYTSVAGTYTFSWDASTNKLTVTYPAGDHPTKRIYMACGGSWCDSSPKFFVHSWLDSNTADTELTALACDASVYSADIPWFHDYVIFTRQAPASTGIVWSGDNFWNRSNGDFYLNNYNKLTFDSWTNDGKGNFTGGTYSIPAAPTGPEVSSTTANSITFSWDELGANANGYKIQLMNGSSVVVDWKDCAEHQYTATDLAANTTYTLHVVVKGTGSCDSPEATVEGTTCQALTVNLGGVAATPAGGVNIGANTDALTCTASVGTISSYQWKQNTSGNKEGAVNAVGSGATSAFFTPNPTSAGTYYYFCVATGDCGQVAETDLSGAWTFNAAACALTPVTCTNTGHHVYAYNDATRIDVSSCARKDALGATLTGADKTFSNAQLLGSGVVDGLTSVYLTSNCLSEHKADQPWIDSYIKVNQNGTITITVAANYSGNAKIKFGPFKSGDSRTLTNSQGGSATTNVGSATNEDSYSEKTIPLVAGANVLTADANLYISHIDVELEDNSCQQFVLTYNKNTDDEVTNMPADQCMPVAANQTLASEVPVRSGYTFVGWTHDKANTNPATPYPAGCTTFTKGADNPETLYAKWEVAAVETPLVSWTMNVAANATWETTATSNHGNTEISSIATEHDAGDNAGKNSMTAKVALTNNSENGDGKGAHFTFSLASGKKVVPEKVTCAVSNVGGSSNNQLSYKVRLSDENGHSYFSTNTEVPANNGVLNNYTFTFASNLVLVGDITMDVYCWKSGNSGTEFRMGPDVKLFGTIADYSCAAMTVTRGGQESGSFTVGAYNGTALTCTVTTGEPASYQWKQYNVGSALSTAVNAEGTGNTTTSFTPNPAAAGQYIYFCVVTDVCGNTENSSPSGAFTFAAAATYSVTHNLTNVTATSGATGASAATEGVAYDAVFAANPGYVLPSTITVTIGGSPATVGTGYTWNSSTGAFQVPAAQVTGAIVITIAGETAPATKDIYYGAITITSGALTKGSTGTVQFFTNTGGTIANNTEISLSTTLGAGSEYYLSNDLTGAELSKSSNWTTSSSSNRYVQGVKFGSGKSYTLALGSKVASSITFYGINGSASKTMTIGGQAWTSSSTKNTFAKHEFTKSGNFTGNVSITQDGDFYGILVITIQTATPCTTPVIPALSNQSLCEGTDIAEWDATQTAVLADGETVTYSWKKKGNDTELANTATFDLGSSAAESQAGTYVVTVTVSKAGMASSTATKEVTLTVDAANEVSIAGPTTTIYPTNSVTLTATASKTSTYTWHTCSAADGSGESAAISGATSATYTFNAPGTAGTYHYKVKAQGNCVTAEAVYTLTVSAAVSGECFHFVSVIPTGSDVSISSNANIVTPTHATTLEGGTMKVGSQQVTLTKNYGLKLESSKSVSITLNTALEAGNVVVVKGTSATAGYGITINGVNFYEADSKTFDVSYTVAAGDGLVGKTALTVTKYSGSAYLQEIKVTGCGASCTDPEVTAAVDNNTVCEGTSVTFTASNAASGATYQWQKYSGGAWSDISGAKSATYNIASVETTDAAKYRVIAHNDCDRTSNEVTLNVPVAPVFNSFTATRSVMQGNALSISDVEASSATTYAWYRSADNTFSEGTDTRVGTAKELLLAASGDAAGSTYYLFCVASNSCGSTTSSAITVNVTAIVSQDCAVRGNEPDADFGFQNSGCGQGTYNSVSCWTMNGNSKILIYSAPDGKYFKTMKVTLASSSASKASYNWSTDGGTTYTSNGVAITGLTTTLTEMTINLSAHGNVNEVKIGRNFGSGESSGTLYVYKVCFEYTEACTATTVTPSAPSATYEMGDSDPFTAPKFTVKHGETTFDPQPTLTYSSSNEDIASVDESGNVTFNGEAGTVTITASYAGGKVGGTDYCASSGSYTITVSCTGGAPKVVADGSTEMEVCNSSVTLHAKKQDGTAFADGTYQWFRNGEEIDGATSASYSAVQSGVYTVEYTSEGGCSSLSTNSATVTSESAEPEITRLVPFQYYHVDKTYTAQMKDRHLFAVKGSSANGTTGKNFKLTMSRNGSAETDMTTAASIWVNQNEDHTVDTVMIDLNKLSGKYAEDDELVLTCYAVDCSGTVSNTYKEDITINVIGATPTLALICSGTNKAAGTRKTSELTVGGDFLTGYNKADLCEQTGNTSFDANTEWGLYKRLKEQYIVTPVNGYANFNKLNYEPFDILLLTDYPKASKSDAAATVLDDMADLCDYRPMLSFKAHMVAKTPSKWAAKGFTTSPVVPKNTRTRLNIVCYAHPMFATLKTVGTHIQKDNDDVSQIVYTMLTGGGYESSKGLQGFELAAADNFVTIGLVHYNATPTDGSPSAGLVTWTPGSEDRMLVAAAERQANPEARMILFAVNCGAQSKFTETGSDVVLECLKYLLSDWTITPMADCSFTFDNGAGNTGQTAACESCTGTKGDGLWSTAANWGPDYVVRPGKSTEVKIVAPVTVDHGVNNFTPSVRTVRITDEGSITIPSGSYLEVTGTIRHLNDKEVTPTENSDIIILSDASGNGSLIFNNDAGDTKATVQMYTTAQADTEHMSATTSTWQYIGTPHNDVASATWNYMGAWLYQYVTDSQSWGVIPNGGPLVPFRGYSVTHEQAPHTFNMKGSLTETTSADIDVPENKYVVAANSWTAPIDINAITDDDMENISDKAIYFFNTGSDVAGTGTSTPSATGKARWAPGTYVSVPIHSAPYTDGSDDHIPSMQGFYVFSTTNGTLHFDYNRHVRSSSRGFVSGRMHAPRRTQQAQEEPNVLKIYARGERYDDRLIVLERQDFTRTYDSGWDGEAWGGSDKAPMLYITNDNGVDEAVSAIPDYEGTVLTFRAGEDEQYRLDFNYSPEAPIIYLLDTDYNIYTRIVTGNSYSFYTFDQTPHQRFIITRNSGSPVVTDINEAQDNDKMKSKPIKFIKDGKIFILVNGVIYDSTGKKVK